MGMFGPARLGAAVAVSVCAFLAVPKASAQYASLCVLEYQKERRSTAGFALEEVEKILQEITKAIGLSRKIELVPCQHIDKVQAYGPRTNAAVPVGDYIIYDHQWLREVIGRDYLEAVIVFAHEVGHFMNGDFDLVVDGDTITDTQEANADYFAGCAAARQNGAWPKVVDLLSRLRDEDGYGGYPDRDRSIAKAMSGFLQCGGEIPDPHPPTRYGAYAVSRTEFAWGLAFNAKTLEAAKTEAVDECRRRASVPSECTVLSTFVNACAAFGYDQVAGRVVQRWGYSSEEASRFVERDCPACRIHSTACTDYIGQPVARQ